MFFIQCFSQCYAFLLNLKFGAQFTNIVYIISVKNLQMYSPINLLKKKSKSTDHVSKDKKE